MSKLIKDNYIALTAVPDIQEICKPLEGLLGIDFFCYHKILPNGKEVFLSTHDKWVSHVLQHNLTLGVEYADYCTKGDSQKFAFTIWSLENQFQIVQTFCAICNSNYGITLKNGNNEYFGFSINKFISPIALNTYLNNIDLLERFCLFFLEKAKPLIAEANKRVILYSPNSVSKSFKERDKINKLKSHFIEQTPVRKFSINNKYISLKEILLSMKEIDCLKQLIIGDNMTDIATKLGLSKYTIKTYIENIKNKFGASNQNELLKLIFENNLDRYLK